MTTRRSTVPAVPLAMPTLGRNTMPVAGKIKTGVKTAKAAKAIETFRFTSNDRASLEVLAQKYGGEIKAFADPKSPHKLELISNANEIEIILPPNPLGDSPVYEKFGGKGIERRCFPWLDAPQCSTEQPGPDGPEPIMVPCICEATNAAKADRCKPTTRLRVLLPQCRLAGVWELVSHSEQAANEMPTMVALIESAGPAGLTMARMKIDSRESRGGTTKYKMPVLFLAGSIEELVAGQNTLRGADLARELDLPRPAAIGSGQVESGATGPASGSAERGTSHSAPDSDIIDAEIVPEHDAVLRLAADLWGQLTDGEKAEARKRQQAANLPPKASEMTTEQAVAFSELLDSVIGERPFS